MRQSIVLTALFAMGFSATAHAARLERVAVGVHPGFTRIVFHLDDAAPYEVNWRSSGAPMVLLEGIEVEDASVLEPRLSESEAPLTGITLRAAPAGLEALIAVDGPVRAKSFALTPDAYGGYRVVVDVSRSGPETAENNETGPAPSAPAVASVSAPPGSPAPVQDVAVASPAPEPAPPAAMPGPKAPLTPSVSAAYPDPVKDESPVCATYGEALDENQWNMDALITYGACLSNSGNLDEAAATFERILSFDPDFHRARLNLASVYARQGRTDEARAAYKYVLLSAPPADVVRVIQAALHDLDAATPGATAQK